MPLRVRAFPTAFRGQVRASVIMLVKALSFANTRRILPFFTGFLPINLRQARIKGLHQIRMQSTKSFQRRVGRTVSQHRGHQIVTRLTTRLVTCTATRIGVHGKSGVGDNGGRFRNGHRASKIGGLHNTNRTR